MFSPAEDEGPVRDLADRRAWPATLTHGRVTLRPFRYRDLAAWREVRLRNREWLQRWEPTAEQDWSERHTRWRFVRLRSALGRAGRDERMLAFALLVDDRFAGQVNLGPVLRGSMHSADVGYWIDRRYAGLGITPVAVALTVQYAFGPVGLHRVHAAIQPDNAPSIRVMEKLGFRHEAYYERYLDIDGAWRDHLGYALTVDDDLSSLRSVLASTR